jgi:hypothetical protein
MESFSGAEGAFSASNVLYRFFPVKMSMKMNLNKDRGEYPFSFLIFAARSLFPKEWLEKK